MSMFRSTKRKRVGKTRIVRENDDDEEEEGPTISIPTKKTKVTKASRTTVRNVRAADVNNAKRSSLLAQSQEDEDHTQEPSEDSFHDALYDPEALAQLQAEQAQAPPISGDVTTPSLWKEAQVLTGEEALELQHQLQDPDDDWERAVAQRAGADAAGRSSIQTSPAHGGEKTLAALQQHMRITRDQLLDQNQRLALAITRRQDELEHLHHEGHATELAQHGDALEFYQTWRLKLVEWVNAMRHLNDKVQQIEASMNELKADVAAKSFQRQHQDDIIYELHRRSLLHECLGRQPPVYETPEEDGEMDEFGRPKVSRQALERQQRQRKMARIREQRNDMDASDAYLSDQEKETLRERHTALVEALDAAVQEMDEEYTQLHNLVTLFQEWYDKFPEGYVACYASLSLSDLMSVLVRHELCHLNDPWNESESFHEAKWTTVVFRAYSSGIMSEESIDRLLVKSVLPVVDELLQRGGYNLLSSKQSQSLSVFYKRVAKIVPMESPALERLRSIVAKYIQEYMQEVSIPILRKDAVVVDDEGQALLHAVTDGQLRRLQHLLRHILVHWGEILTDDKTFIGFLLDFISNRFILLVSSIQNMHQEASVQSVADVCSWLEPLGVLAEDGEWAVEAAPIRAAAAVYSE